MKQKKGKPSAKKSGSAKSLTAKDLKKLRGGMIEDDKSGENATSTQKSTA
jgi:hypothetical protein